MGDNIGTTHRVPPSGLPAWNDHEASLAVAATLEPGLEVQLVSRWGDWAHIRCTNGWMAWVDGRQLEALSSEPKAGSRERFPASTSLRSNPLGWTWAVTIGGNSVRIGISMIGAALAVVGSMLSWFSIAATEFGGGLSLSSFDIKSNVLIDPYANPTGPDLGLLLLAAVAGFVVLTLMDIRERERGWIGGVVVLICLLYAIQLRRTFSQSADVETPGFFRTLGFGVYFTMIGGGLMLVPTPGGGE